jgi:hypothetical protein
VVGGIAAPIGGFKACAAACGAGCGESSFASGAEGLITSGSIIDP